MKKTYENLSIRIVNVLIKDVITTSGFDGWEQEFDTPATQNPTSVVTNPDNML